MAGYGHVWTEEKVKSEILKCMDILGLDRMPTSDELKGLGRMDLHNKISRTKKYSGWAEVIGLERKSSETTFGQHFEDLVCNMLMDKGHSVERMTTRHPYDLLINGSVKADVKAGTAYLLRGKSRIHSFLINKKEPTSDLYVVLALDEIHEIERLFIIPSHRLKLRMLNIGANSKYNNFIDRWDYFDKYTSFHQAV